MIGNHGFPPSVRYWLLALISTPAGFLPPILRGPVSGGGVGASRAAEKSADARAASAIMSTMADTERPNGFIVCDSLWGRLKEVQLSVPLGCVVDALAASACCCSSWAFFAAESARRWAAAAFLSAEVLASISSSSFF